MKVKYKLIEKDPLVSSGIYIYISLSDYNFAYIGQTGRNFKLRFKELLKSCNDKNIWDFVFIIRDNVARHMLHNN